MPEQSASLTILLRAKDDAEAALAKMRANLASLEGQLALVSREGALTSNKLQGLESAASKSANGLSVVGGHARDAQGRFTRLGETAGTTASGLSAAEQAASRAHPQLSRVGAASRESEGHLHKLGEGAQVAATGMFGLEGVAKMAGAGVAVGLGLAAGASVKLASDFQKSTTELVTGAGESEGALDMVRKGLLTMSSQVGVSAVDLSKGMYMIESAGYHGAEGLKVLEASTKGAKVGGSDMATVANAVTSALNAYHLPASQAVAVTNDLVATVGSGKMHMEDLAGSLGKVLPAASTAHVSLAEVSGALATMTMQGTDAESAATYLRMSILQLENPSGKARDTMKSLGLSAHQVGETLGHQGLAATFDLITERLARKFPEDAKLARAEFDKVRKGTETADDAMQHLANNTSPEYVAALANMTGGAKGMQAALELTGGNLKTFRENTATVSKAVRDGGTEVKGWAQIQGDFSMQLDRAKQTVINLAISLGTHLLPYLTLAASWFADNLPRAIQAAQGWFEKNRGTIEMVAHVLANVLVAAFRAFLDVLHASALAIGFVADHHMLLYPILLLIGAQLTFMAARWTFLKAAAIESAIQSAIAAEASAIRTAAVWTATRAGMLAGFLAQAAGAVAAYAVIAAEAVARGAQVTAVWLAQRAEALAGFALEAAGAVAAYAVMAAGAIATGLTMAAAWIIGLGPIGLIIAAVLALGAVFVGLYAKCEGFRTVVNTVFNFVRDHIQLILTVVVGILTGGLGALVILFVTHFDQIKGTVVGVFTAVAGFIRSVWNTIAGLVGAALGLIWGAISGTFNAVRGFLETVFGAIVGSVARGVGVVISWFASLPGRVMGAIGGLIGSLVGWAGGAIGGMLRGLESGVGGLLGFFGGLWDRLVGAVGDIAGRAWGLGRTVVGKIADGVGSAASWVWDRLKHVLGDVIRNVPIVGGKVADALGLASGGLIRATPGGTLARIAEGGEDEFVIPMSKARGLEDILLARLGLGGSLTTVAVPAAAPSAMITSAAAARVGMGSTRVIVVEQPQQVIEVHTHVDLDGREIARSTRRHMADANRLQMHQLGSGA